MVDKLYTTPDLQGRLLGYITSPMNEHAESGPSMKTRRTSKPPVFATVLKGSSIQREETRRQQLLSRWTSVICMNVDAFDGFGHCTSTAEVSFRDSVMDTVSECLASKATSTLAKRLGSILAYTKFCSQMNADPFPLAEETMYKFLKHVETDTESSASKRKSFLEAVRFLGCFQVKSSGTSLISPRLEGLAVRLAKEAPPIRQADPLRVEQVALERFCMNAESNIDRSIAGAILIMVYGCARVSDISRTTEVIIDRPETDVELQPGEPQGFIELCVVGNKGARTQQLKRLYLPVVAPMVSVSGCKWFDSWVASRESLGLVSSGKLRFPFMCRYTSTFKPTGQSMGAGEVSEFLRRVLDIQDAHTNTVRSHSCKCTILSWMAKAGSDLQLRRTMSHHLDVANRSVHCYSRDDCPCSPRGC